MVTISCQNFKEILRINKIIKQYVESSQGFRSSTACHPNSCKTRKREGMADLQTLGNNESHSETLASNSACSSQTLWARSLLKKLCVGRLCLSSTCSELKVVGQSVKQRLIGFGPSACSIFTYPPYIKVGRTIVRVHYLLTLYASTFTLVILPFNSSEISMS